MARKSQTPSLEAVRQKLAELNFQLTPMASGRLLVRKYECAAVLESAADGAAAIALSPGRVVGGHLARLIDRGYQKFFKTPAAEVPVSPAGLRDLASFQHELAFAMGVPVLYNQSLGTVSDRYLYDRIWHRDEGAQPRPWLDEARQLISS